MTQTFLLIWYCYNDILICHLLISFPGIYPEIFIGIIDIIQ